MRSITKASQKPIKGPFFLISKSKMHAVQSALAIRRERERRQSLKSQRPSNGRKASTDSTLPPMGAPSDFRSLPESNGTFNYTTVGVSFIIFGSLMLVPIFAGGHEVVGLDWRHLLGKTLPFW